MSIGTPVINSLPVVTSLNVNAYPISGSGVPNGTIYFSFIDPKNNKVSATGKINGKGSFSLNINLSSLSDGQLSLETYQMDKKTKVSNKIIKSILKDTIGPAIHFQVSTITPNNQLSYPVTGTTEANTQISLTISDGVHSPLANTITADSNGFFSSIFNVAALNDGDLTISGTGSDFYGNTFISRVKVNKSTLQAPPPPVNGNVYELNAAERSKWGIYNDGTHPIETTNGLNNALKWAHNNSFNGFHVPGGTYLIAKGVEDADENAQINMVSDMTFLMDPDTVLQKETNKWEQYSVIALKKEVRNVVLKGGTLKGDRDTHDYSYVGQYTSGTHEWGFGILAEGPMNIIIDGITFQYFTGDGVQAGGTTVKSISIGPGNLEPGGLDANGKPVSQTGKIRTNTQSISLYTFSDTVYQDPHYRNIMMWTPSGVTGTYDLFYYRNDGSLLRADKDQSFNSTLGYSKIPDGASYWRAVFNAESKSNASIEMMSVAVTENLTIQNCDIGNNRRQGISLVGTDGVRILSNTIHDIHGTAPESGIDMEPGFYPALNTEISGNKFSNNHIHLVLSYGGHVVADNNYFGPGASFYSTSQLGVSASNNTFDHSSFVGNDNVTFKSNKLINSDAIFNGGSNILIDGIDGLNSYVSLTQTVGNGIQASNISLKSSGNDSTVYGIDVWGSYPIHLNTAYLQGNNSIGGTGIDADIFDNVTFDSPISSTLVAGTYNNLLIKNGRYSFSPGKVFINQAHFQNTTLYVSNPNSMVTIQNSTFDFSVTVPGNVITAMETKNIIISNNTINDMVTVNADHAIIQIGQDAGKSNPTKVFGATIQGNVLKAHAKRAGIDTTNGGLKAPAYTINNNTLYNCTLSLTSKDINSNNTLLSATI